MFGFFLEIAEEKPVSFWSDMDSYQIVPALKFFHEITEKHVRFVKSVLGCFAIIPKNC